MRIPYITNIVTREVMICYDVSRLGNYTELPGEYHQLYEVDVKDRVSGAISSLKCITEDRLQNHDSYKFLKELIDSRDTSNLLIAFHIIKNIPDE